MSLRRSRRAPREHGRSLIHSGFLKGFTRNRQQSQTNHIEIIAEKLTVKTILEGVAEEYSIPLTINRGMSGPTMKKKIADRYRRSKKKNLILLVVSDLDPAGAPDKNLSLIPGAGSRCLVP